MRGPRFHISFAPIGVYRRLAQCDDLDSALVASVDHMEQSNLSSLEAASRDSELVILQARIVPLSSLFCTRTVFPVVTVKVSSVTSSNCMLLQSLFRHNSTNSFRALLPALPRSLSDISTSFQCMLYQVKISKPRISLGKRTGTVFLCKAFRAIPHSEQGTQSPTTSYNIFMIDRCERFFVSTSTLF